MTLPDPDGFAELLAGAQRGDRDAWDTLYRRLSPGILGYLRSQRAPHPEDLLADVWTRVVPDLASFEGGEQQLRAWLLTIAHNRLVDVRRQHARRPEVLDEHPPEPLTDSTEVADIDVEVVKELLDGLPENQRAVLYLRYVLELSQREIAQVMGSSVAAVKMLQARAVRAAASRMGDGEPGSGEQA